MAEYLRTSERSTYKSCRQKWWWTYEDKIKPRIEAPPLRFGTLIHGALEQYYIPGKKRGADPADTFLKLYEEELKGARKWGFRDEDGTWHDAAELGHEMMINYVSEYGADDEYRVIASEQTFKVPLLVSKNTGKVIAWYVGKFDGVWEHMPSKEIVFNDFKTAKSIDTRYLVLDEQAGAYWTFGPIWLREQGILPKNKSISHILYTFLRKAKSDTRPQNDDGLYLNKDGAVSKQQPSPLFHREKVWRDAAEHEQVFRRALAEYKEMEMIRAGDLEVYKAPGKFTCGMCGLAPICEVHEAGSDWEAVRDSEYTTWEPYEDHNLDPEREDLPS